MWILGETLECVSAGARRYVIMSMHVVTVPNHEVAHIMSHTSVNWSLFSNETETNTDPTLDPMKSIPTRGWKPQVLPHENHHRKSGPKSPFSPKGKRCQRYR